MIWIFWSIGSALTSSAVIGESYRDSGERAIFFENGSSCGVLVGVEQGAMRGAEPAVQRAAKAIGCPREHIIVSAVHTHSGGTKNAANPDRDAVGKCAYRHDYLRSWDSREDWFKCTFLRAMGQGSFFMFTCRKCFAKTQFVADGATGPESLLLFSGVESLHRKV